MPCFRDKKNETGLRAVEMLLAEDRRTQNRWRKKDVLEVLFPVNRLIFGDIFVQFDADKLEERAWLVDG